MPSRIACVLVPLFPLAARLRSEPDLAGEAVAVLAGNGHAARVVAASKPARRSGVRSGQTLREARALLPRLIARASDAECERSAHEALLEAAETVSPRLEDAGAGAAWLDVDGLELYFGFSESALARSLMAAVESAGLPARVGIAASKLAARVAAESSDAPRIVRPGEEAGFLAPLPIARLSPPVEIAEALARWGLARIGDVARLAEGEVAARFGEAGRRLHAAARGVDPSPLVPRAVPPVFSEGMDLEWPFVAVEPFLFVARAALERLTGRLAAHALACVRLETSLVLDPEGLDSRAIDLPAPTRDVKTLLTLVRLDLEGRPPGAPVSGFRFVAHPDRPRPAQLSLFGPAALSPEQLATCIARLVARLGEGRVGQPVAVDGHRPGRFALAPYAPPPPQDASPAARPGRGLLAIRVLRPALPIDLDVEEGKPMRLTPKPHPGLAATSLQVEREPKEKRIEGTVRVASGPWRVEEKWWSDETIDRDYWDVELSDGGLYRIFREAKNGAWFVDGIYD
ncbi:MAG TPA: DNA polymerase Y family protein [Thermoanaerobaculia bacterium]|nr:DNA polymerase Y family protein [Thermoanaerobaculia bacterium]